MSQEFIELSTRVAETVFRLKGVTPYKNLRYSATYDPTINNFTRYHITLQAETPRGSTLRYQCFYLPETNRMTSMNKLDQALKNPSVSLIEVLKDPSVSLTIDQIVAEIEVKFGSQNQS